MFKEGGRPTSLFTENTSSKQERGSAKEKKKIAFKKKGETPSFTS